MRTLSILLIILTALFFSCTTESLQPDASLQDDVLEIRGKKFVPFKLRETGMTLSRSDAEGIRTIIYEGSGVATHLGRFTSTNTQTINLATPQLFTGTGTYTAANGDQLFFKYSGSVEIDFSTLSFKGDLSYTFDKGTGRFEHAEGEASGHSSGVFSKFPPDPDDVLVVDVVLEGEISY